ncbi:MAG: creatininase family protein [Xanthobacteraceae bacterium]
MPGRAFFWAELKSNDFRALDPETTIAILPIAATEQHGPHLPVMTDNAIAEGMIALLKERLPADINVLVLPTQAIGKSNEHLLSPGTLSLSAETLQHVLVETGEGVRRAGLRKMVLANSHGGNASVLTTVARELRVRFGMLVVATHWRWFGLPNGMYDAVEARHGIHAGDVETSLMLSFRRELVSMDEAKNFVSSAIAMEKEFTHLGATGSHAFGWIAQDLNTEGAVGDAGKATADKGQKTAEHQIAGFITLLRDMTAFSLNRLYAANADPIR